MLWLCLSVVWEVLKGTKTLFVKCYTEKCRRHHLVLCLATDLYPSSSKINNIFLSMSLALQNLRRFQHLHQDYILESPWRSWFQWQRRTWGKLPVLWYHLQHPATNRPIKNSTENCALCDQTIITLCIVKTNNNNIMHCVYYIITIITPQQHEGRK